MYWKRYVLHILATIIQGVMVTLESVYSETLLFPCLVFIILPKATPKK
jgi:hypothetical protein